MVRPEKAAAVEEIRRKLQQADAAVLTEYRGLTVKELANLRAALRPASTEYKIFKNTLARRAADEAGFEELVSLLEGPVAIAFVDGDAVVAAKALRDFGRGAPALVVKGGLLGNRVLSPADVAALAEIEPRDVLLAKLAGAMQAPLVKAAGLFQALPRSLAYGVKALIDQRVAGGEAPPPSGAPAADAQPPGSGSAEAATDEAATTSEPGEPAEAEAEATESPAAAEPTAGTEGE
jgi:large subunit ribosomal protein L10